MWALDKLPLSLHPPKGALNLMRKQTAIISDNSHACLSRTQMEHQPTVVGTPAHSGWSTGLQWLGHQPIVVRVSAYSGWGTSL